MTIWIGIAAVVATALLILYYLLTRPMGGCACGRCRRSVTRELRCRLSEERPTAWLEFRSGPMQGQKLQLVERVTRIGSVGSNDIVLSDPAVSQQHVSIERKHNSFTLRDVGSTNGVYVNAVRESKIVLAADDLVTIGNSEVALRIV